MKLRPDHRLIGQWIAPGSRVLDLGCGDGSLLASLRQERQVNGYGLEIDIDDIVACIDKGVNVIHADLDAGLADFDEDSFDYVIMSQALQAMRFPDRLLDEMLRVGREGIVTFPNFGHWPNRVQLFFGGHMPVTRALPAQWYNTRNIHLCTIKDFEILCREKGIEILERNVLTHNHRSGLGAHILPNLLGEIALYRFRRKGV